MKLHIPIYNGDVWVFLHKSEFIEALEELHDDPEVQKNTYGDFWCSRDLETESPIYLIGVYEYDIDTLVHEINHAALNIIENAGFSAHDGNGEPFCYLSDYLVGEIYPWFLEQTKKESDNARI